MFDSIYRRNNLICITVLTSSVKMLTKEKHRPSCKVWLECEGEPILGKGGAEILEAIKEEGSISKAARKVGMSYRYVWNYLDKMQKVLQEPVVETYKGGKTGGGGARLTELGESLLKEYRRVEGYVGEILVDEEHWEAVGLKISARNRLKGVVKKVEKGNVASKVKIEISEPMMITALISREAVEELDIRAGDSVEAVIKATEVMIAKEKDAFGTWALFDDEPRVVTATTLEDCVLLCIRKEEFYDLLSDHSQITQDVLKTLSMRLRRLIQSFNSGSQTDNSA